MTNALTSTNARPEFLRFPRTGQRCLITGLSRPFLYTLAKEGKIKTVSLRDRNKQRGVRLISADSLLAFINSHTTGGPHEAAKPLSTTSGQSQGGQSECNSEYQPIAPA